MIDVQLLQQNLKAPADLDSAKLEPSVLLDVELNNFDMILNAELKTVLENSEEQPLLAETMLLPMTLKVENLNPELQKLPLTDLPLLDEQLLNTADLNLELEQQDSLLSLCADFWKPVIVDDRPVESKEVDEGDIETIETMLYSMESKDEGLQSEISIQENSNQELKDNPVSRSVIQTDFEGGALPSLQPIVEFKKAVEGGALSEVQIEQQPSQEDLTFNQELLSKGKLTPESQKIVQEKPLEGETGILAELDPAAFEDQDGFKELRYRKYHLEHMNKNDLSPLHQEMEDWLSRWTPKDFTLDPSQNLLKKSSESSKIRSLGDPLQNGTHLLTAASKDAATALTVQSGGKETFQSHLPMKMNSPEWEGGVGQNLIYMAKGGIKNARISLNPPELGPLEVKLNLEGDKAHVSFHSRHALTKEALEDSIPKLKEMFKENNVELVQVNVQLTSDHSGQGHSFRQPFGFDVADGRDARLLTMERESEVSEPVVVRRLMGLVDFYA